MPPGPADRADEHIVSQANFEVIRRVLEGETGAFEVRVRRHLGQPEGTGALISTEEIVGKLRAPVAARQDLWLIIVGRTAALNVEDAERVELPIIVGSARASLKREDLAVHSCLGPGDGASCQRGELQQMAARASEYTILPNHSGRHG